MNDPMNQCESIFAAAVAMPNERELVEYLDRVCANNSALRNRVEALLEAHNRQGHFLDKPIQPDGPEQTRAHVQLGEKVGTLVAGRYKLLEQIGEGGMGAVWLAEQVQPIRRKVALKLIKAGMDSKVVLSRFDAERQALALMDHPNIARVLDGGTTESGRPFFAMEYVKGIPLTEYCDNARLNIEQRLQLFVPVCQAVQHAHQKGIIHRDLKPTNILVCIYDGQPVPKVIDFGLAKAIHQPLTEQTLHTAHGMLLGTPLYMSPEQAEFNNLDVDTRTDIYALGVILYELLTGTTPLERQRLKEAAWQEMLRLIKEEEPPRPSARLSGSGRLPTVAAQRQLEPIKLAKTVQGELDWIVMKCLEKNRSRRYESASGLARDVEHYLADESVDACPPSATYRLWKFGRKHQRALTVVSIVALALAAGIVISSWQAVRARRAEAIARMAQQNTILERDRALQEKQRADEQASIANAVSNFLQYDLLAEAAPENNPRAEQVTVEKVLGRAAARIAGKFDQQPQVEAAIQMTIGDTYQRLGNSAAARPHLERALLLRRRLHGEDSPETLECMNSLGNLLTEERKFDQAEPLLIETLERRRRVFGDEDVRTLQSMNSLANFYQEQFRLAEAEPLLVKSVEVSRRILGPAHVRTLLHMNSLAVLYKQQKQFTKAEPLYLEVLKARQRILGKDHPQTLVSLSNLALLYQARGEFARAEPLMLESLERARRVFGDDHSDMLRRVNNLAWLYHDWGQFERAEPLFREAMQKTKSQKGHPWKSVAAATLSLGENLLQQRKYSEAEATLRDCLELQTKNSPKALKTSHTKVVLGACLLSQGKYDEAEQLLLASYEALLLEQDETFNERHPDLLEVYKQLAELYREIGKEDKAAIWHQRYETNKNSPSL